jgi:hypothetical protein
VPKPKRKARTWTRWLVTERGRPYLSLYTKRKYAPDLASFWKPENMRVIRVTITEVLPKRRKVSDA